MFKTIINERYFLRLINSVHGWCRSTLLTGAGKGWNDAIKMRSLNMGTKKVNAVSGAGKTVSFETRLEECFYQAHLIQQFCVELENAFAANNCKLFLSPALYQQML